MHASSPPPQLPALPHHASSPPPQLPALPPLWDIASPLTPGTVDAWNYTERLRLYKSLIDVPHCLWNESATHDRSPLWGLPLQHGWQRWHRRRGAGAPSPTPALLNTSSKVCSK